MPNHVTNRITFDCSDEKAKEILQAVMYDPDPNNQEHTGFGTFDFNKLIPMPENLNIDVGSKTDGGIEIYLTAINPNTEYCGFEKMPKDEFDSLLTKLNKNRCFGAYKNALSDETTRFLIKIGVFREHANLGKQAIDNLKNYDAIDWYEWRCRNWGTKWNAYDCFTEDDRSLAFNTAWSAPHLVVEAMSKKYPDVLINHEWADEDFGYNCGRIGYKNGEIIYEYYPESLEEGVAFAKKVLMIDDEE